MAVAATAVLLTGCGTALARPGAGHSGSRPRTAAVVSGPRAQAQAYVRHLMAELSLPPGTEPAHLKALPQIIQEPVPGGTGWVAASRILIVPGQPSAVLKRISGHAPFNEPGTYVPPWVRDSTMLAAPQPGIDVVILDLTVEAHSRTTTLVGAYAFAAWLPHRTAAEHLDAASYRAVTIVGNQVIPKQRTVSRTFTSPSVIARFAAFLNGRSAVPESALGGLSCPPPANTYVLRFTPRQKHGPAVTASPYCLIVAMTVNGKPQPALWDTSGLESLARTLLGR